MGRQVEADGHRRELLLVGDDQRRGGVLEARDRAQRHHRAARYLGNDAGRVRGQRARLRLRRDAGGRNVDLGQRGRVVLVLRHRLEDHAVLVGLPVDGRDLALAEGVAQGVDDGLHGDAEAAGGLAVDLRPAAGSRRSAPPRRRPAAPATACSSCVSLAAQSSTSFASVPVSVYWYCARLSRVEIWMSCTGWKNTIDAGDRGDRLLQPLDDVRHRRLALVARAQRDGEPAGIGRGIDRRHADHRDDAGHLGVLADRAPRPSACSRFISVNETSWPPSITAKIRPVSCSGRKPFGMTM